MKYCTNCGTQLSDDAKFCSVCGTRQEAPKAPEPKPEKPKRPAAPRKPASQQVKPDNNGEVFFTATEEEGEVVSRHSLDNSNTQHLQSNNTRPLLRDLLLLHSSNPKRREAFSAG